MVIDRKDIKKKNTHCYNKRRIHISAHFLAWACVCKRKFVSQSLYSFFLFPPSTFCFLSCIHQQHRTSESNSNNNKNISPHKLKKKDEKYTPEKPSLIHTRAREKCRRRDSNDDDNVSWSDDLQCASDTCIMVLSRSPFLQLAWFSLNIVTQFFMFAKEDTILCTLHCGYFSTRRMKK